MKLCIDIPDGVRCSDDNYNYCPCFDGDRCRCMAFDVFLEENDDLYVLKCNECLKAGRGEKE